MAGDWIKMQGNLWTSPKVVRIMSACKADKCRIIGALYRTWCLFDEHTVDGKLEGYTKFLLDDELRLEGFSDALESIGWLIDLGDEGLQVPDFDEHMSKSAKRRAQENKRKRDSRKMSASNADKKRTREEKRREYIKNKQKKDTPPAAAVCESPNGEEIKKQKFDFKSSLVALGVEPSVASQWLKVRRDKKASNTELAFKRIEKEISKTGWLANDVITLAVEKSWKGFEADWLPKSSASTGGYQW